MNLSRSISSDRWIRLDVKLGNSGHIWWAKESWTSKMQRWNEWYSVLQSKSLCWLGKKAYLLLLPPALPVLQRRCLSSAFRVRRTFHSMLLLRGCVPFPRVVKPKKVRRKKLLFKVLQPFRNSSLLAEFMLKKAFQTEETHPRSDIFTFYNQHLTWISYQLRIALEKPLYHPWKLQPCILISIHIDI